MTSPPAWASSAAQVDAVVLRCHSERPDWLPARFEPPWVAVTNDGCWEWQGERQPKGYGRITLPVPYGRKVRAHRAAWLVLRGPIPYGMTLDHAVCQNTACLNPDHLEVVTLQENLNRRKPREEQPIGWGRPRGSHVAACPQGHAMTEDNLVPGKFARGIRECLACRKDTARRDYALQRLAAQRLGLTITEYRTQYGQTGRRAAEVLGIPWEAARHVAA